VKDHETTQDIISETFLSALKSIDRFRGGCSESTYLISILKRKIIDFYRKKNTEKYKAEIKMLDLMVEWDGNWFEDCVTSTAQLSSNYLVEKNELETAITHFLKKLNPVHAQIFHMKTMVGVDNQTICKKLKVTEDNIWVVNHRVRKKLASYLSKNGFN